MSTFISDYSQFYAGTEQLKSYGSDSAMKDIRSRYDDNVIVQFSGDGMTALADSVEELTEKINKVDWTKITEE